MGMLRIETWGSFKQRVFRDFAAQKSGHAIAVHDAIAFLKSDVLPEAIEQDQELRASGVAPDDTFEKADSIGLLRVVPPVEAVPLEEQPAPKLDAHHYESQLADAFSTLAENDSEENRGQFVCLYYDVTKLLDDMRPTAEAFAEYLKDKGGPVEALAILRWKEKREAGA